MVVTIDTAQLVKEIQEVVRAELNNFKGVAIVLNPNKPVSTKELCGFLGVSEPTIIRMRKSKKIPFMTVGSCVRYDLDKVIKALEKK